MNTITIIGAGNMGGAMAEKLLETGFCTAESLCIVDPSMEKLELFEKKGCPTSTNAADFIPSSHYIILAVKPQLARTLLEEWKPLFKKETVLCSIVAGVNIASLSESSGCEKVVRIMPNTPLLVGKGVCGWYANEGVPVEEKTVIQKMLNCFGLSVPCETEDMIDGITGLSGSGPAYFFYLLEHMETQAVEFGFSKGEAKEIALQTMLGAGELVHQSEDEVSVLRSRVTSKGGTTQAAIESFDENNLDSLWRGGIKAAYNRSKEL